MNAIQTTTVTLTGTGVPHPAPGRAGAGVLIQYKDTTLQFDAGRGTVIRLAECGIAPHQLSAVFLTHVHSDHVMDLADVVLTRWIQQTLHPTSAIEIVCPWGAPEQFVTRMLDAFEIDIDLRIKHVQEIPPKFSLSAFEATSNPQTVWQSPDGTVSVLAIAVHHEPVPDAVAYRVNTPNGSVVISGDTRVCPEVEAFARGTQLLIHEACRTQAMSHAIKGSKFEQIFDYHADTIALGQMAARTKVPHLVLTHLIPQPRNEQDCESFISDIRTGGYTGKVTVGSDLDSFEIN